MENNAEAIRNRRPLSLDGVRTRAVNPPVVQIQPPQRRVYFKPHPTPKKRKIWEKLQLPLLLLTGVIGGFFADNLVLGLALLAAYGVFALITRVASRVTFTLALLLLGTISILLLVKPSNVLIRNFSTYAFVLLLIGAITLGRETRLPKRMRRKY